MENKHTGNLLWGSGYSAIGQNAVDFCSSGDWEADLQLLPAELAVSKAHVQMLASQNIISNEEKESLLTAISKLEKEGAKLLKPAEDIHTSVYNYLSENSKAGNFRCGLSRNDQVAASEAIFLNQKASEFKTSLLKLAKALAEKAKETSNSIMPGYTHHQQALPTTLGHLLLAFAYSFKRDAQKFDQWLELHSSCPLGAGTGFSTTFPINSAQTADLLGFSKAYENSLDAIASRWELEADFAYCLASTMTHLSILAQTLMLFSTSEFDYIQLSEKHTTGSSAMPQKKNPDVLEAIKAKTTLAHSSLLSILSLSKSNLAGYNKDSQFGKQELLKAISHFLPSLAIMPEVIAELKPNTEKMLSSLQPSTTSLAVAEQLTLEYKIPFNQSRKTIEKALAKGSGELKLEVLNSELKQFGVSVQASELSQCKDANWVVEQTTASGPNPSQILKNSEKLLAGLSK
ncbi:argininosuccinate lyase [Candidatus Micrarchaeota archaeon]|nr:MAG: argininosuccinate lyase [Candidatus Micrarchaeota archaeon]